MENAEIASRPLRLRPRGVTGVREILAWMDQRLSYPEVPACLEAAGAKRPTVGRDYFGGNTAGIDQQGQDENNQGVRKPHSSSG